MIHESSMVDGQSRMRMRDQRRPCPAAASVAFAPEGLHVMLTGVTKTARSRRQGAAHPASSITAAWSISSPSFVRSTRSERAGVNRPESPADHVTPYDRFAWSDTVVEHLLASGEHPRELTAYFGAGEYAALAALAREAQRVPVSADAPRVYIVPGIMGSQLGRMRRRAAAERHFVARSGRHQPWAAGAVALARGRVAARGCGGTQASAAAGASRFRRRRRRSSRSAWCCSRICG